MYWVDSGEPGFKVLPPGPGILRYTELYSSFVPDEAVQFLLENYPQIDNHGVKWIIEGGYVVQLLANPARPVGDVDLVCRDATLNEDFRNARNFDIKTAEEWISCKGYKCSPALAQTVLNAHIQVEIEGGRSLLVMDPALIAAGKTTPYMERFPRLKDKFDALSLARYIQAFKGQETDRILWDARELIASEGPLYSRG